ncbi:HET-domain-containing protein [Mycena olivaceomarginata]|nr:HET-domain-containing protein [Mycena olivaceomarginata]
MPQYSRDSEIQSLVCDACWQGPFSAESFEKLLGGNEIHHCTTWSKIRESIEGGCGFCTLLLDGDEDTPDSDGEAKIYISLSTSDNTDHISPSGVQILGIDIDGWYSANLYWLYTSSDDPAANAIVAKNPIVQVDTAEAIGWARNCIARCLREHSDCPKPAEGTPLPTRVIDCAEVDHPRLFVTEGQTRAYAALSYVWGQSQPNSLRVDNLEAYTCSIDVTLIPQTIRDAIKVTCDVGLRYLWVDSLCIMQDSREDKSREIARMRTIYHNAYITIIAARAPTVSSGFLQDLPTAQHMRLPFRLGDGGLGTVAIIPEAERYDDNADPVNQRAWCLEERLLSPRRLVFGSDSLQYHCQTSALAYDKAIMTPRVAERLPPPLLDSDSDLAAWRASPVLWQKRRVRWAWMDALRNYTRRALTHQRDKLVALGGVAEQFQRLWDSGRYLAGLWEETLTHDLLWFADPESPLLPRCSQYLAPTWSWASVDSPIYGASGLDDRIDPSYGGDISACEIIGCTLMLKDPHLNFGGVTSGKLALRAPMLKVEWQACVAENVLLFSPEGHEHTFCVLEADLGKSQSKLRCAVVHVDVHEPLADEVRAVPIRWNRTECYVAGIFLAPAGEGKAQRIGFWESSGADEIPGDNSDAIFSHINESKADWQTVEII